MASTDIQVGDRTFKATVHACKNSSKYLCLFCERAWFGYNTSNKNKAELESDEVYEWFKEMVEDNLPQDKDGEQVLNEVVERLTTEFESVGQTDA